VTSDPGRRRTWIAAGLLVAAVVAVAVAVARRGGGDGPDPRVPPSLLEIERDGLRWTYHLPSGTEALFDLTTDPRCLRNLAPERAADADRLRKEAERREGESVERLREHYREQIERLRSLGYL